ncbi:hypothetical protein QR680_003364 [Steinernema hermaphroditum]|uniref:Uncharacterized protein n=1 Tax=Steinernema hermaphroditum TaxID=289476 RepID=A0AA39H6G1_9BILA|nr:hypothetical protein QR680_003364 [Steinernema hermaphroditum]
MRSAIATVDTSQVSLCSLVIDPSRVIGSNRVHPRMYHPAGARQKDVSTRLIRPTLPEVDVSNVLAFVNNWDSKWEYDGSINVHDEGIAQYPLTNKDSHLKFYASLIISKPSLRCRLEPEEPEDILDLQAGNVLTLVNIPTMNAQETAQIQFLKDVLSKRGYRFDN